MGTDSNVKLDNPPTVARPPAYIINRGAVNHVHRRTQQSAGVSDSSLCTEQMEERQRIDGLGERTRYM